MQIMIDTTHDRGYTLLAAIANLAALVRFEAMEGNTLDRAEGLLQLAVAGPRAPRPVQAPTPPPIGKPVAPAPVIPLPAGNEPVAPVEHPPVHPDAEKLVPPGTQKDDSPLEQGEPDLLPPQSVFGGTLPGEAPPVVPAAPVAVVPVVPSAPTVTAGAVPPVPAGAPVSGEVDKQGFPWDARIHSETKKVNADGTWRMRRNLDEGVRAAVVAELKAAVAARGGAADAATFQPPAVVTSGVPVPPAPAPVPVAPVAAVAVPVPPAPTDGGVPPAPVTATVLPFPSQTATAPPVPVPPAPGVGVPNANLPEMVSSFRELIQLVNISLSKGAMTHAQVNEACAHVKVDSITGLASQPVLIPDIYQYMRARNWLIAAA